MNDPQKIKHLLKCEASDFVQYKVPKAVSTHDKNSWLKTEKDKYDTLVTLSGHISDRCVSLLANPFVKPPSL